MAFEQLVYASAFKRRCMYEDVRVGPAVIAGLRFAWHSPALRSTLVRSFAFFLFASALWAMLPLIAKDQLSGGAALYGLLLTSVGAGAVAGALVLPKLKKSFSPSILVAIGTVGIALVLAIFATVSDARLAVAAAAIAGASWIMVLSSLNVSAQTALPNWVRARGLSIFLTVFFGAMSAGSLVWGQIASLTSIPTSLLIAASGAVALIPLTWRARLNQGEDLNHSPSMHWPAPILAEVDPKDRGPVMIQLTYTVDRDNADEFQRLMDKLAAARRRNGAYGWSLMQAAEDPMTFVETWYEASWLNHLRHHERVTESERTLQTRVWALLKDEAKPQVAHYLAPSDQTEKN